MKAMVIKEFRELSRDRRTLALLLVVPVLLLVIFGYAANFSVTNLSVAVSGPGKAAAATKISKYVDTEPKFELTQIGDNLTSSQIREILVKDRYAAVVVTDDSLPQGLLAAYSYLYIDGSDLFTAQAAARAWGQIIASDMKEHLSTIRTKIITAQTQSAEIAATLENYLAQLQAVGSSAPRSPGMPLPHPPQIQLPSFPAEVAQELEGFNPDTQITILFNPDLKTSWVMVPGLVGLILAFVGIVITSIGLVRERESGTLEQLAVMPLTPAAIVLGKILPYFILALFDILLIGTIAVWLFGVPFEGSTFSFTLVALVFLLVVLGIGILISSVSQSTGQAIQLAIMAVMPQVLLSGLIFPLESMATGVRWIGYLLPLTWFNQAAQGIMLRGATLSQIATPVLILTGLAAAIFTLAIGRMHITLTRGGAIR